MNKSETENFSKSTAVIIADSYFILALISLGALAATFIVSNSGQTFQAKLLLFTAVICLISYFVCFFIIGKSKKTGK